MPQPQCIKISTRQNKMVFYFSFHIQEQPHKLAFIGSPEELKNLKSSKKEKTFDLPILWFSLVDMAICPSPNFAAFKLKQILHFLPETTK